MCCCGQTHPSLPSTVAAAAAASGRPIDRLYRGGGSLAGNTAAVCPLAAPLTMGDGSAVSTVSAAADERERFLRRSPHLASFDEDDGSGERGYGLGDLGDNRQPGQPLQPTSNNKGA